MHRPAIVRILLNALAQISFVSVTPFAVADHRSRSTSIILYQLDDELGPRAAA